MFRRVIINLFGGHLSINGHELATQTSVASPSNLNNTTETTHIVQSAQESQSVRRQPTRTAKTVKKEQYKPLGFRTSTIRKRTRKPVVKASPPRRHRQNNHCNHYSGKSTYVKKAIPKSVKVAAWILRFGKAKGCAMCPICEFREMLQADHVCGHIVPECKGGATVPDNLMPICNQCNLSMSTMNMYSFKKMYFPASIQSNFWKKHMRNHHV